MEHTEYAYDWTWHGYNVIAVGWEDCVPNLCFGPGLREVYTIHYILSGCGTFWVRGKEYHLRAGQLFAFSPYETVCYKADAQDPWSYVWINFAITGTVPYRFEQPVITAPYLRPIFNELMEYPDHLTTGRDFSTHCLIRIAAALTHQQSNAMTVVDSAIQIIHNNYGDENLSVASIAAKLGISRYMLSELFSVEKGVSPIEYLVRYRLEKACEYMVNYRLAPTVAANSVGYKNYVQFNRIFKKYYGKSPRAYIAAFESTEV